MNKLAINGGMPVSSTPFPQKRFYGKGKIKNKIMKLIDTGVLSDYRGNWSQAFFGGEHVREVEDFFGRLISIGSKGKYKALAVNSCTSALIIACGAIGLKPGDEVIVTPWSMSCSATAPMVYGAVPVFADIDEKTFNLDPESIREKITPKTKAIIVVDLFGHPYNLEINEIAKEHNLFVIEDAAQAIGATRGLKQAGSFGDISCFSFTQGKNFHCGEGGMIVTKNESLYLKSALIRNHAEAVVSDNMELAIQMGPEENMIGFNMRMTEIQAIILREQLEYYEEEIHERNLVVERLYKKIRIDGIEFAEPDGDVIHAWYVLPFLFDEDKVGVNRELFMEAIRKELPPVVYRPGELRAAPIRSGYIKPLYKMPIFSGWSIPTLPVVESLQNVSFCLTLLQGYNLTGLHTDMIAEAFYKVYANIDELITLTKTF